MALRVMGFY